MRQRLIILLGTLAFAASAAQAGGEERLVIHEWGTFTAVDDEEGRELTGVNVDDEPVPSFVHNLNRYLLADPVLSSLHWAYRQKAAPRRHPMVTLRLETPVIYFHPPTGKWPSPVDVRVEFRGGWLTEFFPQADADAPGLKDGIFDFGELTPSTIGSLHWRGLEIGRQGEWPQTDEHVWLAPRRVSAAPITTPEGESEQYLFYRGVGNQRAPLRVTTDREADKLALFANFGDVLGKTTCEVPAAWLVEIRGDGTTAFRTLPPLPVSGDESRLLTTIPASFDDADFSAENLRRLKQAMHEALEADGLFADEATALLATWRRAYFESPGLRLFFLVPQDWTDHYLPLEVSADADIDRVMVGRIELITPRQRELLNALADADISDGQWLFEIPESDARAQFLAGRSDFGDLGVEIPSDYRLYLELGRFRNALLVAEERRRPSENLTRFIEVNGLSPFRLPGEAESGE